MRRYRYGIVEMTRISTNTGPPVSTWTLDRIPDVEIPDGTSVIQGLNILGAEGWRLVRDWPITASSSVAYLVQQEYEPL